MSDQLEARSAEAVSASKSWTWAIKVYDLRGQVQVDLSTDCPWRPKQAKLALYEGSPPSDPTKWAADKWWAPGMSSPWNTGKPWGPGWSAALVAMDGDSSDKGTYYYVVKTQATEEGE